MAHSSAIPKDILSLPTECLRKIGDQLREVEHLNALSQTCWRVYDAIVHDLYRRDLVPSNHCVHDVHRRGLGASNRFDKESAITWAIKKNAFQTLQRATRLGIAIPGHLTMAIRWGRDEMVRLLWESIEKSGNLNLNDDGFGDSSFIAAVARLPDVAHLMLATGKVNIGNRNTNEDTALMIASRKGDFSLVESLLALGADHSSSDMKEQTPLSLACELDLARCNCVSHSDSHCGSSNCCRRGRECLVTHADEIDRLRTVELLISSGAEIDALDEEDQTPLHHAVRSGNLKIVQLLVRHGANVNARDQSGSTPLIRNAQFWWDFEIASFLVDEGADVCATCSDGNNALCYSFTAKDPIKLALFLLQHGASVTDFTPSYPPGQPPGRRNVLHDSVMCPDLELTELFLDHGANINCLCSIHGTPLQVACCWNSSPALIRLLVARGADVTLSPGWDYLEPLAYAVRERHPLSIVKLLLDNGANPEGRADWGMRVLHLAVDIGSSRTARILIEYGANPDSLDSSNRNCLYYAAKNGNMAMLKLLHKHGALIEHACGPGDEILTDVLYHDSADECLEWLVRKGIDVNKHGRHGDTALHMVTRSKSLPAIKLLLDHGAEFDAKNNLGETPLDYISSWCELVSGKRKLFINCGSGRLLLEPSWAAGLESVPLLLKVLDALIPYKDVRG